MAITEDMIEQAAENIIRRRDTHLDQLADKLRDKRALRVVEAILKGGEMENIAWDDGAAHFEIQRIV